MTSCEYPTATQAPSRTARLERHRPGKFLGVSRPTLVKILEDGKIPYDQPGRHRRLLFTDLLAYQQAARQPAHRPGLDDRGRQRGRHPQLWTAAGARKAVREESEARAGRAEEERAATAKAVAYNERLDHLAARADAAWREAENLIETKKPRDYDLAVALLRDLSALARRDGDDNTFTVRFRQLRSRHERKPSLQERFDKAGLPRHP